MLEMRSSADGGPGVAALRAFRSRDASARSGPVGDHPLNGRRPAVMVPSEPLSLPASLAQAGEGPSATWMNTFRTRLNPLRVCHVSGLLVVLSMQMFR